MNTLNPQLTQIFQKTFNSTPLEISSVGSHKSTKKIYRIKIDPSSIIQQPIAVSPTTNTTHAIIAIIFDIQKEFEAYKFYTEELLKLNVPVPVIYSSHQENLNELTLIHFVEDLGDVTLFDLILESKNKFVDNNKTNNSPTNTPEKPPQLIKNSETQNIVNNYKTTIKILAELHSKDFSTFDFSKSYPTALYDAKGIVSDLKLFLEEYVVPAGIKFDYQELLNEITLLAEEIFKENIEYTLILRDLQSRNIMLHQEKLYLIDIQGARKGPVQYDLVSLLTQTKVNLAEDLKEELLSYYFDCRNNSNQSLRFDHAKQKIFKEKFQDFNIIRLFQSIGSSGRAGYRNNKVEYLEDVKSTISKLKERIKVNPRFVKFSAIKLIVEQL